MKKETERVETTRKADDELKPKPRPAKPTTVDVVMVKGPRGGKPRRWLTGPPVLSRAYDFKPCCATTVSADDAKLLLAGIDGRVFVRDGDKAAIDALEKAHRPQRGWR